MNFPTQRSYFARTTVGLGMLLATLTATGCTNPMDPTEVDEPKTAPAISPVEYRVDIDFKRIRVVGDCDGDPIIGENKGEIAYRLQVSHVDENGKWTSRTTAKQTVDFGGYSGQTINRGSGSDIYIGEMVSMTVPNGKDYRIHFTGIEWDGHQMDSEMDMASITETNTAGGKAKYEHGLDIGPNTSCRLKLYVDARETRI